MRDLKPAVRGGIVIVSARDCLNCPYRGRPIYVVGPHRFKNEVLLHFLESHTAGKLFLVENLSNVPLGSPLDHGGQKMILLDCVGRGEEELLALFQSWAEKNQTRELLALFNLQREIGLETEALIHGVRGLFYPDDSAENLIKGICAIRNGDLWASRKIMEACLLGQGAPRSTAKKTLLLLSAREREILSLLAMGATNDSIAQKLFISPHTVKTHLSHIFKKIKVHNRVQAALWAEKHLRNTKKV